jgi:EF hand
MKLDANNDGFITYDEFVSGLAKIIKFSDRVYQGLFAYMDR